MKSFLLGSAVCVLLVFSVISYARAFTQRQDPKHNSAQQGVQQAQTANQQPGVPSTNQQPGALPSTGPIAADPQKPEAKGPAPAEVLAVASPASLSGSGNERASAPATPDSSSKPAPALAAFAAAPQTYTATAYSLRGRTASGKPVSRGLIAADPAVLPLGTRVRVEAGSLSGEYVVGDTGGAVRGRHIDIWTPTSREARQFGRRAVKLTVLAFGARRGRLHSTHARSRRKS